MIEILRVVPAPASRVEPSAMIPAAWGATPLPQSLADCHALIRAQAELLSALQAQVQVLQSVST